MTDITAERARGAQDAQTAWQEKRSRWLIRADISASTAVISDAGVYLATSWEPAAYVDGYNEKTRTLLASSPDASWPPGRRIPSKEQYAATSFTPVAVSEFEFRDKDEKWLLKGIVSAMEDRSLQVPGLQRDSALELVLVVGHGATETEIDVFDSHFRCLMTAMAFPR
jgi:hypothetical protein